MCEIWQDQELKFDFSENLEISGAEFEIDSINHVEDTKGNNGVEGLLKITNLRIIWYSKENPENNLSIGYNTIRTLQIDSVVSKFKGTTHSLYVTCKYRGHNYLFIFTNLVPSPRLFTSVQAVYRSYGTTRIYREVKMRGSIIKNNELVILPGEKIYSRYEGVHNATLDSFTHGILYVTNVRLVWYSSSHPGYNISLPYIQLKRIQLCDTKNHGRGLHLKSHSNSSFAAVFIFDSQDELAKVQKELSHIWRFAIKSPVLGIQKTNTKAQPSLDVLTVKQRRDQVKITSSTFESASDPFASYVVDGSHTQNDRINVTYSQDLGLAIQEVPKPYTLSQLWDIIPENTLSG
eukprot:TRINITY_DN7054_c0_g1_i1.p1 TRINITY_DN7054_c0_g1~~TRINITY_DN7054_c0_g1_i1.p1  ORF type:complete len:348 (+),score=72.01 TRINITY_DN7054_c0_g1_i1:39-1082(+)